MQQNVRAECPKCSRPLQQFNGRIGYCSQHHWVSPLGLGFDAEATEQNRQDAASEEKRLLEAEREKIDAQARENRKRRQGIVRKTAAVIVALCLIAFGIVFFVVRPYLNYDRAAKHLTEGDYQTAQEGFEALNNYKDSPARVLLCKAMIDLQANRPEDAMMKLNQLIGDGQEGVTRQLAGILLPLVANWKEKGLTPQALLLLLTRVDLIDPDGTLDFSMLQTAGHAALLDDAPLSAYAEDVNGDGEAELIVLNGDYSVAVYRMTSDENIRMAVDHDTAAACALSFGQSFEKANLDSAIACFSEAYHLFPNAKTGAVLADAYRIRSSNHENAGRIAAAIADARSAMEISGSSEGFDFFYEINLRQCRNTSDESDAIALWNDFAAGNAAEIIRYSAETRWQNDAAQLHIAYAAGLAARKDANCVSELRAAATLGADVTEAVSEAESHFDPGIALALLRVIEIEQSSDDAERAAQIRSELSEEVRAAISEWKTRQLAPAEVPVLIRFADRQGIDLSGIDCDIAYEEAAVAAAGPVSQSTFVDWNTDGYKELLALDTDGKLILYGLDEVWGPLSSVDTEIVSGSYSIVDESAPLILVLSSREDELLAVTASGSQLGLLFREIGLSYYQADEQTITFSRELEGSIERYNKFTYKAIGTASRPVLTGIDWQQSNYPQPTTALSAIERYFEARSYDIAEEAAFLTQEATLPDLFNTAKLAALTAPDTPDSVTAVAYQTGEDMALFEVSYVSEGQQIRAWVAAEFHNGWKLVGAADTYGTGQNATDVDYSIRLISLNEEIGDTLSAKGSRCTYRLLVPTSGRLGLVWQSGTKAESRTSHTITLHHDALTSSTLFSYDLQPSPNRQQSKDLFVSAGVYYLTVEARTDDTAEYRLTIMFEADANVELEGNDEAASATPVALNVTYSGSLSSPKDVDCFTFMLEETSAVNVTLDASGSGGKTSAYVYTVFSVETGNSLATISLPGNVQHAKTGNLYLSSGTYWVQVAKGSTYTNDEYMLTVNVSQNGTMESEANDTPETADAVPLNEDIHASIGQEGDIDYYTFSLDGDAVVQPRFSFKPTGSSSKIYVLTLMDSSRRELLKANIGGKESTKVIAPVALTAGVYTVKIDNPRFVCQDYTLHLVSIAVDSAEKEPNDSAALATDLLTGSARTGVLTSDADVDYYKMTFSEQTTVTLSFSFAQSTTHNTAFVLSVEQNGRTQWATNIKGDSGGLKQLLQFPAGEYYVKVKPSSWLGAVYTITLE